MVALHTGDLHLSVKFKKDSLNSLRFIRDKILEGGYDVLLIAGDFWDTLITNIENSPLVEAVHIIEEIAQKIPIIVIYGNHDRRGSLEILSRSGDLKNRVKIVSNRLDILYQFEGNIYNIENIHKGQKPDAIFYCIPYPYPSMWLNIDEYRKPHALDMAIRKELIARNAAVDKLKLGNIPKIIVAHGGLEKFKECKGQHEYVSTKDYHFSEKTFSLIKPDYIAMAHIHLRQTLMNGIACYPSSTYSVNMSETDEKTFSKVQINKDEELFSNIPVVIPHRKRVIEKIEYNEKYSNTQFSKIVADKIKKLESTLDSNLVDLFIYAPKTILPSLKLPKIEDIRYFPVKTDKTEVIKTKLSGKDIYQLTEEWLSEFKNIKMTPSLKSKLSLVIEKTKEKLEV